jgi:hypothetical protein
LAFETGGRIDGGGSDAGARVDSEDDTDVHAHSERVKNIRELGDEDGIARALARWVFCGSEKKITIGRETKEQKPKKWT